MNGMDLHVSTGIRFRNKMMGVNQIARVYVKDDPTHLDVYKNPNRVHI